VRAGAGLLAVLLATSAAGQELPTLGFKMLNTEANPFEFWIDNRPGSRPASLPVGVIETAARGAAQAWDDVDCASTAFSYQSPPRTEASASSTVDGFNVVAIWVRSIHDPAYDNVLGGGTADAAAVPMRYAGVLATCDIFLNAVDRNWSVASPTPADHMDVQTALLHELGHCQGLDHNYHDPEAVMFTFLPVGASRRTPNARDRQHLCAWSPRTGKVGSPCTVGQSCGAPGLTCVAASDTQGRSSYPVCSTGCGPMNPCADPYVCTPSTVIGGQTAICLPPGGQVTAVGHACNAPADCGTAASVCLAEGSDTQPSGATVWEDGYCTQRCGPGHPECPSGSACRDNGGVDQCFQTCRIGTGDCRAGYACDPGLDGAASVCVPRCGSDADCGSGSTCRTCDGTCLVTGVAGVRIGDTCGSDLDCGTGQHCAQLGNGTGVCSQRCETACTACPTGSTCHQVGGERLCLRDCESSGNCASGLQCAPLESGAGCFPACTTDSECPVGNVCDPGGQCVDPSPSDGGCGALCGHDGGRPPDPRPDGGMTPPVQGGCGCGAGVGGPAWILLTLLGGGLLRLRRPRA